LMNKTFRGTTLDWSDENENVSNSIRANREFDSNVIDGSESQCEKDFDPKTSRLRGHKIDWSDDSSNACDSILVKGELIQIQSI
jgi:hypothetical protein